MSKDLIPLELRKFIARYIHSVEQLEILCLLVESPDQVWQDTEVYRCIQSSQESVTQNLQAFANELILSGDSKSGYQFSSKIPEMARLGVDLVKNYRAKRVTIIEAIYQTPLDPIRDFADAFRIRKEKP